VTQIKSFTPSCEQEVADKQLFLDCFEKYPDVFTRENKIAHFVSSAFVMNQSRTKCVAAYHKIKDCWLFLGGHMDGETDFLAVCKKEIYEESGLEDIELVGGGIFTLESLPEPGHMKRGKFVPAHVHLNVTYVFIASEKDELRIAPDESSAIAWLPFDQAIAKTKDEFKPIYQKIFNKLKNI